MIKEIRIKRIIDWIGGKLKENFKLSEKNWAKNLQRSEWKRQCFWVERNANNITTEMNSCECSIDWNRRKEEGGEMEKIASERGERGGREMMIDCWSCLPSSIGKKLERLSSSIDGDDKDREEHHDHRFGMRNLLKQIIGFVFLLLVKFYS